MSEKLRRKVNVYQVSGMVQVEVDIADPAKARAKAMRIARHKAIKPADCKQIVICCEDSAVAKECNLVD